MAWFVDVNVWVAAFREDHPFHSTAKAWVERTMRDGDAIYVTVHVLAAYLRLVTNARMMNPATSTSQAVDYTDWLLSHANVQWHESKSEWPIFRKLVETGSLTANAIPDAHLAAIAEQIGAVFVTFDRDFKKLLPSKALLLLKG